MRNDTLRKKLNEKLAKLQAKIEPTLAEIRLTERLLAELDAHEGKTSEAGKA